MNSQQNIIHKIFLKYNIEDTFSLRNNEDELLKIDKAVYISLRKSLSSYNIFIFFVISTMYFFNRFGFFLSYVQTFILLTISSILVSCIITTTVVYNYYYSNNNTNNIPINTHVDNIIKPITIKKKIIKDKPKLYSKKTFIKFNNFNYINVKKINKNRIQTFVFNSLNKVYKNNYISYKNSNTTKYFIFGNVINTNNKYTLTIRVIDTNLNIVFLKSFNFTNINEINITFPVIAKEIKNSLRI